MPIWKSAAGWKRASSAKISSPASRGIAPTSSDSASALVMLGEDRSRRDHRRAPERRKPIPRDRQARSQRGDLLRATSRRRASLGARSDDSGDVRESDAAGARTTPKSSTSTRRSTATAARSSTAAQHQSSDRRAVARPGVPADARRSRARLGRGSRRRAVSAGADLPRSRHDRRGHQGARSGGAIAAPAFRRVLAARARCISNATTSARRWSGSSARRKRRRRRQTPAARCCTIWRRRSRKSANTRARSAVFVELESESGGYRDVADRIDRLSKAQAKG